MSRAGSPEVSLDASGALFFVADTASTRANGFVEPTQRVGGFVERRDAHVTTHSVVVYGGFFAPFRTLLGAWVAGVAGDHVTLRVAVPDGLELLGNAELRAEVPCDDIALDGEEIDGSVALHPSAVLRRALLPANGKVALSVGPSDPPIARFSPDRSTLVSVLEEEAGRSRIFWSAPTGSVFGWVSSRDLRRGPPSASPMAEYEAFEAMRDVEQRRMADPLVIAPLPPYRDAVVAEPPARSPGEGEERVACLSATRVLVELGGRRYAVGQIPEGAPFVVRRLAGAVSPLATPPSLDLASGAALVVSSREIVGCTASRARPTRIRYGEVSVTGRMPLEIIQRTVGQNFGRFRLCYENGRKIDPELQGRVTTTFVIDPTGAVSSTADGGSDLPDPNVVGCVVHGFGNLSFPAPEAGMVTVKYPIQFYLGE